MPPKSVQCPFRNKGQNLDFQSGSMKVFLWCLACYIVALTEKEIFPKIISLSNMVLTMLLLGSEFSGESSLKKQIFLQVKTITSIIIVL